MTVRHIDFTLGSRPEFDYDAEMPVRDVLLRLSHVALPPTLPGAVDEVCRRAAQHEAIAPYLRQRWSELDETDQNLIAAAVGLAARDVFLSANAQEAANEP